MLMASCGKARIKVKEDWQESPSIYVLGVSRSGTQKSVLIKRIRAPFEEFEAKNANQISPEIKQIVLQEQKNLNRK